MRKRGDIFLENTGRGGPPLLIFDYDVLAFFPPAPPEARDEKTAEEQANADLATLRGECERGGFPEAVARMLIAVMKARRHRPPLVHDRAGTQRAPGPTSPEPSEADLHSLVAKQALLMQLDPEAALEALPRLLPSEARPQAGRRALAARVMMLEPELADPDSPAAKPVQKYSDLEPELAHDPGPGRARGDVTSGEYHAGLRGGKQQEQ